MVSNKHLRIYSVVYDNDNSTSVDLLVYAEDLSRNGTFWNGSLIGKGNGGFLLSDGDTLRVSSRISFVYLKVATDGDTESFDLVQEREMKVSGSYNLVSRIDFCSISQRITSSQTGSLELERTDGSIWPLNNREKRSLHVRLWICESSKNPSGFGLAGGNSLQPLKMLTVDCNWQN